MTPIQFDGFFGSVPSIETHKELATQYLQFLRNTRQSTSDEHKRTDTKYQTEDVNPYITYGMLPGKARLLAIEKALKRY